MDPELLSGLVDGELTGQERAQVEAELETSPESRRELAELRETRALLLTLSDREPPAGLWNEIADELASDAEPASESDATAAPVVDLPRRRIVRWMAGAAAAAVVAAVVLVPRPSQDKPAVAELADTHATLSVGTAEPVSHLAPAAVPASFGR